MQQLNAVYFELAMQALDTLPPYIYYEFLMQFINDL